MQVDDVVRLLNPIIGYPDPLGHVRTIEGGGPEGVAYVERDDGKGTGAFLVRELEVVDVAELEERTQASPVLKAWTCKCTKTLPGRAMVCDRCGRAKPWKATA